MHTITAESAKTLSQRSLAKYGLPFLGIAVLFLVLVVYQIYAMRLTARAAAVTNANNLALVLESKLNDEFAAAERTVSAMVAAIEPDAMRPEMASRYRPPVTRWLKANVQYVPSASALRYYDAKGDWLYSSVDAEVPHNVSDRPHFQQIKGSPAGSTVFSEVTLGRATGRISMYIAKAIRDSEGSFLGTASVAIDLTALHQHFQNIAVGAKGVLALRRLDNGASIVRFPGPVVVDNQPTPELPVRYAILNNGPVGFMDIKSRIDGSQRIYGYRKIGAFPFFIAVGIADSDYLAEWRSNSALLLLGALLFLATLATFFFRLTVSESRRNRSETRLRESEKRYHDLFDQASEGLLMMTADGQLTEVNQAFARMHGYTVDELERMDIRKLDVLRERTLEDRADVVRRVQAGEVVRFEVEHYHKDGHIFPISVTTSMIHLVGQMYYLAFHQDISERKRAESALQESKDQFTKVVELSPLSMALVCTDGTIEYINRKAIETFGYTHQDIPNMDRWWVQAYPDETYRAEVIALWMSLVTEALAHNREIGQREYRVTCKNGSVKMVAIFGVWIADKVLVIFEDITERKRAEQALARESHRNQVFLRNASDGVHILDADGNVLEASDSFCAMLGYSREEIIGANLSLWDAKWSAQELKRELAQQLAQEGPSLFETRHRRRDGSLLDVEITGQSLELDGKPALFNSARDITERKRAQEALRESENRLSAVVQANPIGIIVRRVADGKILEANDAALRLYGYTRDEVIGHTIGELGTYANPAQRADVEQRLREQGGVDRFPIDFRNSRGEIGVMELSARVIELQGEQCVVAMMVEVTERKRLEEAHLQAQKLESLGTLTGGIAHDFNNILAAIRGNADLAAADVGPDHAAAQSLEEIRKASARASELVRRIMAFGRPREPQRGVVDLSAVVGEVLKLLRSTLPAGISLIKDFSADTPHVLADAGQIHEAIVNLTTNAAYAIGPRAGSIEYRLEPVQVGDEFARGIPGLKPGRYVRLTVTDDGCGMDAATLERVFDAFYTTKPVGDGTGLGLSMVHGIMRSHGGAVTVQSTPGKGSSFALYFPAAKGKAQTQEQGAAAQSLLSPGRRVMYVDDEEPLVFLANRALSRLGHQISSFTDPIKALEAFRAHPQDFDVVVTDLSMPHMSGFELARELLALRPNMPVLMTSGYIGVEDEARARAAGIREVILKPTTIDELGAVLDRLFRDGEPNGRPSA